MKASWLSHLKRRLGQLLLGLTVLCLVGAAYEQLAQLRDVRRYPPPGRLVDIGGRQLHLDCQGAGAPTVLLESGFTDWTPAWSLVQSKIAAFSRVCSYDRAGMGYSDPDPQPRTSQRMQADLWALLQHAAVAPPYVLVGHSGGGMYQRVFAQLHPEAVRGMLLIDSQGAPAEAERHHLWPNETGKHALAITASVIGLRRVLIGGLHFRGFIFGFERLPQPVQDRYVAGFAKRSWAMSAEQQLYDDAYHQLRNDRLGDYPIVVVGALADKGPRRDAWAAEQKQMLALSPRARLVLREDLPHYVQIFDPDFIVDTVRALVMEVRAGR